MQSGGRKVVRLRRFLIRNLSSGGLEIFLSGGLIISLSLMITIMQFQLTDAGGQRPADIDTLKLVGYGAVAALEGISMGVLLIRPNYQSAANALLGFIALLLLLTL